MTLVWASDQAVRRWEALVEMARRACHEKPREAGLHLSLVELLSGSGRWSEARACLAEHRQRFPDSPRAQALAARLASRAIADSVDQAATAARDRADWQNLRSLCSSQAPAVGGSAARYHRAIAAARLGDPDAAADMDASRDSHCGPLTVAGSSDRFLEDLLVAIKQHPALDQSYHPVTTKGAWQSENLSPLDHPVIGRLMAAVRGEMERFLVERPWLRPPAGIAAWDLSSWAVRYPAQGRQASHFHPDAWLSAVFAVATPVGSKAVLRLGSLEGSRDSDLGEPWPVVGLKMRPGDLVIFPSWLPHAATATQVAGERTVIAFDMVPEGGWLDGC